VPLFAGRRRRKMIVAIGSENPAKIEAGKGPKDEKNVEN
jgi:hypothetical protein